MPGATDARPILVTGAHRSGTTWTGRMLAVAPETGYIHEPFNVDHRHGVCRAPIDLWFTHVHAGNEERYAPGLARTLAFDYDLWGGLARVRSSSDLKTVIRTAREFRAARSTHARPLMKDPLALFSAEWLASRFRMEGVVMIRHPAAFAASVKSLGWRHPFGHFVAQPELMAGPLTPFAGEIRSHAQAPRPLVEELALLWNLAYLRVADYRERHPEWIFVRHEDLARDPAGGFAGLYARLGLPFTSAVRDALAVYSAPGILPASAFAVRRDSLATVDVWKRRLPPDEVTILRERTAAVAGAFYGPEEW